MSTSLCYSKKMTSIPIAVHSSHDQNQNKRALLLERIKNLYKLLGVKGIKQEN